MITQAKLRNGGILNLGDEVETDYHAKCAGVIFVIFQMNEGACESGVLCNVHVKGFPGRILKTGNGLGLDSNWFKKIQ